MNNALGMNECEGLGDLGPPFQDVVGGKRAASQSLRKVVTLNIIGNNGYAVLFLQDVVDLDNARMPDGGDIPGACKKTG